MQFQFLSRKGGLVVKGVVSNFVKIFFQVASKAREIPRNMYFHTLSCLLISVLVIKKIDHSVGGVIME